METSTQNNFIEQFEALINEPSSTPQVIAGQIFEQTNGEPEKAKNLLRSVFEKLGMEKGVQVSTELIKLKAEAEQRMAIQRNTQFGTGKALKW
jgi:hypothetical protein